MLIQSYRDLEAWQLGMEFVLHVYRVTKTFPIEERYGLASQLQRAAVAIPSNVSEGHQLRPKSFKHFLTLALGSLAEANTQLEIAQRLRYVDQVEQESLARRASQLRQVLHGLRRSIRIPDS